ncbi:MAG TPA: efflux transporter outer membrane subunit [Candidatus Sulfotelmatobacter sp.]|jgi:multidrug efflux system outer membrane protein|nr:efflux transporter outer membrane subunit [Candidatus Sulfotelmatobacter sp.]
MRKIIVVVFLPLLFAGCTLGPKYVRPAVQPPANFYTEQQATAASAADMAWWDLFKDPVLQDLIREALKNNYDLQLALARVEQERALVGVSRSQYYPQVGYGASISGQQDPITPNHTYYSYSFSTLWEIDLFGRIRKLNEAQRAVYFSTEEARRDVRLVVLSDVAQGYFQLRALDEQLEIARRTVKSFGETLDLFQRKFEGGAASGLEVGRAQGALSNVAATIPDFERQIIAQENALNLLLGRNPGPIARGAALADQYDPPDVPAGLPATLLERRPDLREFEQNLIAANANIGVAKANFFPTISLTGLFGGVSPQLSELTASGKAWSIAGNLAGPIFTGGRLKNEYRASLAVRDQAKISFEKAVTQAFGEVSTSLSAHQQLGKAYREQLKSVEAYRDSVRLSFTRYDSGLASYFEIVDAQLQLYPVESSSVSYDLGRKLAMVDLYRALGGGWNLSDSQWTTTSGPPSSTPTPTP